MNRAVSAAASSGDPAAAVHHPWEPAAPVDPPAATGPDRAPDPLAGRLGAALVRMRRGLEQDYRDGIGTRRYRFLGLERYRTHNLEAAAAAIPPAAPAILLAHAPEPFRAAASLGFALMLCGHTHGGQICLPGGFALISHSRAPQCVRAGAWRWRQMQGYTSRGAGSSIIAARFNCPPEVTIHCLRRAAAADESLTTALLSVRTTAIEE